MILVFSLYGKNIAFGQTSSAINTNSLIGLEYIPDSSTPIHYLFKIGGLPYPKIVVQNLYSVFDVNPSFKDSLNDTYFSFKSTKIVTQTYLSNYLINKGYSLIYFKSDYSNLPDQNFKN